MNSSAFLSGGSFFMLSVSYRGRFAPSPTGPLHLGSMLVAFGSWLLARHAGGQWLVRIEDVDRTREVPGAAANQLTTLEAFGLQSDLPVERQSDRQPLYQRALQQLLTDGMAFECHCSRSDLADQGGIHRYCAGQRQRAQPATRLRVADGNRIGFEDALQEYFEQDLGTEVGDFVLLRADGCWAYQLAVVVDDAEQGVTHVVRGADLMDSTPRQMFLQQQLGLATPHYLHLPLLLDTEGRKLSKSLAATPVDASDPLPALRLLWSLLGQPTASLGKTSSVWRLLDTAAHQFNPQLLQRAPVQLMQAPGCP
jgi:glutamyl-Q tRNA(Asp) synthetase